MNQRIHWSSLLILILITLLLSACGSPPPAEHNLTGGGPNQTVISVSGAFALFPMMTVWTEEYSKLNPAVKFDVQAGGAGKGMTDVLSGAADIAMLSREARAEELDQGAVLTPVTIDAVVGVVNANNPHLKTLLTTGLTPKIGRGIWIDGDVTTWGQWLGDGSQETINVYTRADASGAGEMWAKYLGGQSQEELKGTAVNGDPGLAEAVRQDPLGIGFNNIGFAYDQTTGQPIAGLQIVPLDLNGDGRILDDENFYGSRTELIKAIGAQTYPFPPARVLYLVTKGKPGPEITNFYHWVLTDGQAFVSEAGYVALTERQIQEALAQLDQSS